LNFQPEGKLSVIMLREFLWNSEFPVGKGKDSNAQAIPANIKISEM
jgi:hypothetical protein